MITLNDINTSYILNNIYLNMIKINDVSELGYNPKAEDIMFDSLNTQTPLFTQNLLNFNDTIGYLQTADDALNNIDDLVNTLNDLEQNPSNNQSQIKDIQNTISDILQNTTYNNMQVFGSDVNIGDKKIDLGINIDNLDLTNPKDLEEFQKAIENTKGDIESFLNNSTNSLDSVSTNDNFLDTINKDNLVIDSYLLATAHNEEYLSPLVEQLLF